ncbi:SpaA isopeptide-forming pilin-related protein [Faecalibacterium prausnitzii]|uniref:SpaA isopeptide-forming pilin-related protein n=1 Tax=Faecalibacterium prausnitzii TaxID=853 RepID=UPI001FA6D1B4|nr:LPXTG cell wall anchor domain-containing protein [Faecalibacterium prausnitzii]MCI3184007.1 LPXTG cell wall anchor domain-containing protein [Faecalibacterium prausnitzii]MCI3201791.1 LPXTG cell wall anchor domain-containing protein [Faecalibacterium prausnitzii]
MNDILKTYMERFRENRHTLRRYTAFVLALAMITTLFVNWQLHGVGISMTAQYQCGEEEHTHTADCYTKVLTCGYEEGELENADEVAAAAATSQPTVEAEPMPLSLEPQIEFVPHEHTEDCYTEVQTLTCMEEEHVHGDDCFDPEDGSLICDKFEHTHDESCYTTEYELTCGLEEGELVEQVVEPTQSAELAAMAVAEPVALEPTVDTVEPIYHHHTDACYEEVLTCPLPEHHHTVACLSDTSADVETPEEWQAANAEAVMTGNWDEDLLSVAKTQLGYEQSEKNFEIDPADGVTLRYYSRYGQSYGNPYGEWDVMFLSYCLKYAGIPQSAIPQEASVLALRSSMSDMDWLLDGEDGSAANVGDIVIYNKYVTRTVAVDSSADGAADDLDDQFSMDAEGENGAELDTSGASALDAAPTADSVITPDFPDTANPEQPAAKPVDSTGTSASGADTLIPSVVSPAAEPQTTTVTDAQPVETVGIVSEADENTLTVISGDVDGKVAEVTLSNAEVLAVVDVAAAQYADEMLSSAVDGALKAPSMLTLAGEGPDTLTSVKYVDFFDETKKNNKGGITKLTFKVDNIEQTGDFTLEFGKAVNTQFDYYIDAGTLSKANPTLTYKLPKGLEPPKDFDAIIYDHNKPDPRPIGKQTFNTDGTTTLTFYTDKDYFDVTKSFDGSFYYDWEYKNASTGGNKPIQFPGGTTVTLKDPQNIEIIKSTPSIADGTITEDSDGRTRLHYEVVVSSTYGWKEPIWIQDGLQKSGDLLTDKTSYDPSSFQLVKKDASGKETKIDSSKYSPNFDRNSFTKNLDSKYFTGFEYTNLPPLEAGEKYVLSYDVLTAYTDWAELDNKVKTEGDSDTSKVKLEPKVEKRGNYNETTGLIDWTIIVKNPSKADLEGYTVTDTLDNGATITGDIKLFKYDGDWHSTLKETIRFENGNSGFTYTFKEGDNAQQYEFKYSSTVPDTAASVKNTVKYGKGDSQFNAYKEVPIPGQKFEPKKTAPGPLTQKEGDPNTLIAPWTITVNMPHKGAVYKIKDYFDSSYGAVQCGNAKTIQDAIKKSLTLTYLDGAETKTLHYSDLVNYNISLNVEYYFSQNYTSQVELENDNRDVQSFIATLDTTNCKLDLKELSFSYSTTVDVSDLAVGSSVTFHNYIDNAGNAEYTYKKPRTEVNMTKGWRIYHCTDLYAGENYGSCGDFYNYYGATELDYDKNKNVRENQIEYQVTLDLSALNELPETITLIDTLPKGVTYLSNERDGQSASIVFANGLWSDTRYFDLPSKVEGKTISLVNYFRKAGHLEVIDATEDKGQTLKFNITGLNEINFATLKAEGYTELVLRYRVKMTDDRWQNLKFNHNTYTNNVHWKEEKKDASVSIPMKREVAPIDKVGEQVENKKQVKYTLTINPAAANLNAAGTTITLTDVLHVKSSGVHATLDLSSVKLTNTDTGEEVPKAEYCFIPPKLEYNKDGHPLYTTVFTLPDQTPLKLEYVYETDATAEVDLKNTATIEGRTSDDANVTQQKVEGGSTAYQLSVTIHKVDKRNNLYGLPGAEFSLEYLHDGTWQNFNSDGTSYKVDENGNLTFNFSSTAGTADHLQQNVLYRIIEVKAPKGYSAETDATYGGNKRYYFIYQGTGFNQQDAYYSAVGNNGEGATEKEVPPKSEVNFFTSGQSNDLYVPNTANSLTIIKNWKDKDGNFLKADQVKMDTVDVQLYCYKQNTNINTAEKYGNVIQLTKDGGWTTTVPIDKDHREGYIFFIKETNVNKSRFTVAYNQPEGVQVGGTLTFTNTDTGFSDYELPSTGGTGTLPYTAVGGTMMLTALAYRFIHRKRRHEGRADD